MEWDGAGKVWSSLEAKGTGISSVCPQNTTTLTHCIDDQKPSFLDVKFHTGPIRRNCVSKIQARYF